MSKDFSISPEPRHTSSIDVPILTAGAQVEEAEYVGGAAPVELLIDPFVAFRDVRIADPPSVGAVRLESMILHAGACENWKDGPYYGPEVESWEIGAS